MRLNDRRDVNQKYQSSCVYTHVWFSLPVVFFDLISRNRYFLLIESKTEVESKLGEERTWGSTWNESESRIERITHPVDFHSSSSTNRSSKGSARVRWAHLIRNCISLFENNQVSWEIDTSSDREIIALLTKWKTRRIITTNQRWTSASPCIESILYYRMLL